MDSSKLSPELLVDLKEKFEEVSSVKVVHINTNFETPNIVQEVSRNSSLVSFVSIWQLFVNTGMFRGNFS